MRTFLKYAVVTVAALALGLVGGYLWGQGHGPVLSAIRSLEAKMDKGFREIGARLKALENPVPKAVPLDRP